MMGDQRSDDCAQQWAPYRPERLAHGFLCASPVSGKVSENGYAAGGSKCVVVGE